MKKIMMVDDEPDQIYTMKKMLESESDEYDLVGVESGMQCLQLLKNKELPDIIFLDIMMPDMTGWELYERIKDNDEWSKIPIVFLTARTDNVAAEVGSFFGNGFLTKPYDIKEIVKLIEKKTVKK
jgi:CheY-like chemotaxis protein